MKDTPIDNGRLWGYDNNEKCKINCSDNITDILGHRPLSCIILGEKVGECERGELSVGNLLIFNTQEEREREVTFSLSRR